MVHDDELNLTPMHGVPLQLEINRSTVFWENYYRFEAGKGSLLVLELASSLISNRIIETSLDASTRKECLRRLIRLAKTQKEWDGLKRIFKLWKENQWGMESVAVTALYGMLT